MFSSIKMIRAHIWMVVLITRYDKTLPATSKSQGMKIALTIEPVIMDFNVFCSHCPVIWLIEKIFHSISLIIEVCKEIKRY